MTVVTNRLVECTSMQLVTALRGFGRGVGGGGFPWRILIVVAIVLIVAAVSWWRSRR